MNKETQVFADCVQAMKSCWQNKHQTIYEHGLSVQRYYLDLINVLRNGGEATTVNWRLPNWLPSYRQDILDNILIEDIISQYALYHDIGKPFCIEYDTSGKVHFPDHANVSHRIWTACGGDPIVGELIRRDMEIHLLKAKDVAEFCRDPKMAITLLLAGLAEIHSNAQMFGGMESESFKIKLKQINKRGKSICEFLFSNKDINKMNKEHQGSKLKLYIVTRNDLTLQYQLPQCIHGAIELCVAFPEETKEWHLSSNTIVVLAAANLDELEKLSLKASECGYQHVRFTEPDIGDELTAIAFVPRGEIKKFCSGLKLAGK